MGLFHRAGPGAVQRMRVVPASSPLRRPRRARASKRLILARVSGFSRFIFGYEIEHLLVVGVY